MLVTLRGQRLNKKFSSNVSYVLFLLTLGIKSIALTKG